MCTVSHDPKEFIGNKKVILSIIVPAYNAERFLGLLLDSILSQSFKSFELIVVNDGSTDSTAHILADFSVNDERVRVINKSNEGVAVARNIALKQAKGEYILFCDSDDIMLSGSLQYIANSLQQNPIDYLRFEYKIINAEGYDLYPNYEAKQRKKFCGKVVDAATCIKEVVRKEFFLWSGVFRRSIIEDYSIEFLPGCTYNEDTLFMLRYFMFSKYNVYINHIAYGYRKFPETVTASFTEKNYQDIKLVFAKVIALYNYSDFQMQKAVKPVVESLGLRIYQYATEHDRHDEIMEIATFCCIKPLTVEWRLIKAFSYKNTYRLLPVINILRNIIKRIWWQ